MPYRAGAQCGVGEAQTLRAFQRRIAGLCRPKPRCRVIKYPELGSVRLYESPPVVGFSGLVGFRHFCDRD